MDDVPTAAAPAAAGTTLPPDPARFDLDLDQAGEDSWMGQARQLVLEAMEAARTR